jgi:hypothetical protein
VIPSTSSVAFTGLVRASYHYIRNDGTGTTSEAAVSYAAFRGNSSSVTTIGYSYLDSVQLNDTGSIGTYYHAYLSPIVKNGTNTVTTEYGLYVGNMTATTLAANRYAIWTQGSTNKIHFAGVVDHDSNVVANGAAQHQTDGTSALPGYATSAQTNKGMFHAATNVLGWSTVGVERMRLDGSGNLGLGATAFGTNAAAALGIFNGTEPASSPADMVQLYSVDLSAGNATLGLRTETAVVTETVVSDRTLSVRINGTTYKICLKV